MTQWTNDDPGAGSTASLHSGVSALRSHSDAYDDVRQHSGSALDTAGDGVWSGEASGAWRSAVSVIRVEVDTVSGSLDDAAAAIEDYVLEVDGIAAQADADQEAIAAADRTFDELEWQFRAPWDIDGIGEDARRRIDAYNARGNAQRSLHDLSRRRQDADDLLVQALDRALPAGWERVRLALQDAGVERPSQLNAETAAAALVGLASEVVDNPSEEDIAALQSLLDAYADDPEVMSEFFEQLGGTETLQLVETLGTAYGNGDEQGLVIAQRLRYGLSVGSADWDRETAEQFAEEMFYGLPGDPDQETLDAANARDGEPTGSYRDMAISFLFGDPAGAPMGESLTVASAQVVDTMIREDGIAFGTWSPHGGGASTLNHAEQFPGEDHGYQSAWQTAPGRDPAGQILATLGVYPESAVEFLDPTGDAELGTARMEYWFGEHDWQRADGFSGPSGLLLGVTQAEGGPYSVPQDADAAERIATIVSTAYIELTDHQHFGSEHLSPEASAQLAGTLVPYLDGIVSQIDLTAEGRAGAGSDIGLALDGSPGTHNPNITREVLSEILGVIGAESSGAGAQIMLWGVDSVQTAYLIAAGEDPSLYDRAIERLTWLQGTVDGASIVERLDAAARHDAIVDAQIDAVSTVVGALPIPFLGAGIDTGRWVLDAAYDVAVSEGSDWAFAQWADGMHGYPDALADVPGAETLMRAAYVDQLVSVVSAAYGDQVLPDGQTVAELLAAGRPPTPDGGMTEASAAEVNAWWTQAASQIQGVVPITDLASLPSDYVDARDAASWNGNDATTPTDQDTP